MGAGEYVSVRSQRELLEASTPEPGAPARPCRTSTSTRTSSRWSTGRAGCRPTEAERAPRRCCADARAGRDGSDAAGVDEHEAVGTGLGRGAVELLLLRLGRGHPGAAVPVRDVGLIAAVIVAAVLVGLALLGTGAVVGLLSGAPPLKRALRQLAIGYGAAAVTYLLGRSFGATLG